jgi:tetratricopeptide (TPR) repeat protein
LHFDVNVKSQLQELFLAEVRPQIALNPKISTPSEVQARKSANIPSKGEKLLRAMRSKRLPLLTVTTVRALAVCGIVLQASPAVCRPQASASESPAAIFRSGEEALARGALDEAETDFRRVLTLDPRSGAAHANLGVVAMRRKNWESALVELHKAEALAPKLSGVRLNIGLVEYRRANYPAAIPPLQSVVKDQPQSVQARYLLGLCFLFVNRYADAVNALEPLWPKMSDQFVYLYVLSNAAFHTQNAALDQKALERLVQIGGDSPEFHLVMAKAMLARHDTRRALDELHDAEAGNSGLPFLHFNFGLAYQQANQTELAEKAFRQDTEAEPDSPYGYEQLGKLYLAAGREEEAWAAFEDALRREARLPGTLLQLASLEARRGELAAALMHLDMAVKLTPDDHSVHFVRAQVLQKMGRKKEAEAEFAASRSLLGAGLERERAAFQGEPLPDPQLANQP